VKVKERGIVTKKGGGFEVKPIECPNCGKMFKVELIPPSSGDDGVQYCPYCGRNISNTEGLSDDELLQQIEKAG